MNFLLLHDTSQRVKLLTSFYWYACTWLSFPTTVRNWTHLRTETNRKSWGTLMTLNVNGVRSKKMLLCKTAQVRMQGYTDIVCFTQWQLKRHESSRIDQVLKTPSLLFWCRWAVCMAFLLWYDNSSTDTRAEWQSCPTAPTDLSAGDGKFSTSSIVLLQPWLLIMNAAD